MIGMRLFTFLLLHCLLQTTPAAAAPVRTGAEILAASGFAPLVGKRFALVTNHSAMVRGKHILDWFIAANMPPVRIFSPEHGLKGIAEDGEHLPNSTIAGIPVLSLYGASKKPLPGDLQDLDLLVFDLQYIGVRFYTYISTLGMVMEAAAEANVPLLVLDRPNPLGGEYLAGYVRNGIKPSFTSLYPIPIAHGMTVGELAFMIKGAAFLPKTAPLKLTVIPMAGWQREMRWPDTGLPWVATSPNIPSFTAALAYAGTGLLEGTTASEGRGTLTPFQIVGRPDIDAQTLATFLNNCQLPGVRFAPASFTPISLPGVESTPKFRGKEVRGVRIIVTDYQQMQPVETGVAVLSGLYAALPPAEQKALFHSGITDLAGSPKMRQSLESGISQRELCQSWNDEVQAFDQLRQPYLLYPSAPLTPSAVAMPADAVPPTGT